MGKINNVVMMSDLHLTKQTLPIFLDWMCEEETFDFADYFILLGDISGESDLDAMDILRQIKSNIASIGSKTKMLFVLGNHDFYHNTTKEDRITIAQKRALIESDPELKECYLSINEGLVVGDTLIVGHDGYASGVGNIYSNIVGGYADFENVPDLMMLPRDVAFSVMRQQARLSADHIENCIRKHLNDGDMISRAIVVTHVPVFPEMCTFNGKQTSNDALPVFLNHALGDKIFEIAEDHSNITFHVYAGHTHEYQPDAMPLALNISATTLAASALNNATSTAESFSKLNGKKY